MKTFLVALITMLSFNSFALNNSSEKVDIKERQLIHVYCDGVYAGDIYAMDDIADTIEMAQAMCE
ncbi:MAG: hypothetical protein COZ17_12960 [Flavobacteriaceae bacterium CG_4_10_14_3_um_filter_33_47]|nr:MAG: hypothetical protein COW44_09455 [Flavobacteriaceae bacterium CG17_big_fil_post_rev_8_21_14_2_50_33_15]PIY09501.1 MAG: hypothetical protein COZ17_12960 [Flavobacteriaceae bacterium CG_4_10_14_3_um_filter_33_47]PJB16875.1 MAG: hypothetical protein CO117_13865 [Flavobacteriaceae bacterium CG_4_9_14_3_um_filter_33_16]